MERSRVSSKGQTVIPKTMRDALGIKEGCELVWRIDNRRLVAYPVPEDVVQASIGILKDFPGLGTEVLLKDREEDLALDEVKVKRLLERE